MKLARYVGNGQVEIVDEPRPSCPEGGVVIRTEACGLCSGELMDWYMDRKIPHVLGHEVVGIITESQDDRFPVGGRMFAHHHAPCLACDLCRAGRFVHCEQWKQTKLIPGGMAEYFAVPHNNLNDAFLVGDMQAKDAALIEPVACVCKSMRLAGNPTSDVAVVGLGTMGLIHCLCMPESVGLDTNLSRVEWAKTKGVDAFIPDEVTGKFDCIFVCPGSQGAFDFALKLARPEAIIVMFAPLPPGETLKIPQEVYFEDIQILNSYSCGPDDTKQAFEKYLATGIVKGEDVVSDFVAIEALPYAYQKMKAGEILKAMVVF